MLLWREPNFYTGTLLPHTIDTYQRGVKAGRAVMVRVVSVPSTSHRLALSHREAPLAWLGFIPLALFYPSTFSPEICCPAGLLTWRKQMSALLFALKREPRRREGEGGCAL